MAAGPSRTKRQKVCVSINLSCSVITPRVCTSWTTSTVECRPWFFFRLQCQINLAKPTVLPTNMGRTSFRITRITVRNRVNISRDAIRVSSRVRVRRVCFRVSIMVMVSVSTSLLRLIRSGEGELLRFYRVRFGVSISLPQLIETEVALSVLPIDCLLTYSVKLCQCSTPADVHQTKHRQKLTYQKYESYATTVTTTKWRINLLTNMHFVVSMLYSQKKTNRNA